MMAPSQCTMGFLFRDASTGDYAIGTAGHCVNHVGQDVTVSVPSQGLQVNVGRVLLKWDQGPEDSFALVSIRPEVESLLHPAVPVAGGPCGVAAGQAGDAVSFYGHAVTFNVTSGIARQGPVHETSPTVMKWRGDIPLLGGSGAPVVLSGSRAATAVLTAFGGQLFVFPTPSVLLMGPTIQYVMGRIGPQWQLVNSPSCPP